MTIRAFPISAALPAISFRREMDRFFDDVLTPRASAWQPAAEAREDATGFTVALDVPGVSPDSLEVVAEDGVLTVRGSRAERELAEGEKALFREGARGGFSRQFRLPKSADLQAVSAQYAHGVLTVRVAKLTPAQPKRVPVEVQQ